MSQPAALTYEMIQQMIERSRERRLAQPCPILVECQWARDRYGLIACDTCSEGLEVSE